MDRKIDAAAQKRVFDFFGEQPLAADVGKIAVLNPVARGLDDLYSDAAGRKDWKGSNEAFAHRVRLDQGQRRSTGSNTKR